jgi:hypothetical protein
MAKLTLEDVSYFLKANDEQGGGLRKEMAATARREIDYWNGVLELVEGEGAVAKPQKRKRQKSADGKTHKVAILEALKGAKNGLTSAQLREKMEKAGHPIAPASFSATIDKCVKEKEVSKRKKEKGGRDNVYTLKS